MKGCVKINLWFEICKKRNVKINLVLGDVLSPDVSPLSYGDSNLISLHIEGKKEFFDLEKFKYCIAGNFDGAKY